MATIIASNYFQLRIREVKILFYIHFFLLRHSSFLYVVPSFSQKLNICCRAGLLGVNALGFCLSGKVFSSSSLQKDTFAGYRILGWYFSFFQHFQDFPRTDFQRAQISLTESQTAHFWPSAALHIKSFIFLPTVYMNLPTSPKLVQSY